MEKKHIHLFLIYYFIFCFIVIGLGILIGLSIDEKLFNAVSTSRGHENAILVLSHNLKNFAFYLFFPMVSPILQFSDFFSSTFQITLSFKKIGTQETFNGLLPHALFELPNLFLYQGLSQYIFFTLIITKSLKKTFFIFKKLLPLYILSLIVLVIAALLEGYM